jgi:hypothetical protein
MNLPKGFIETLQWNGSYATDFHQDFSTALGLMMYIEYDQGRDHEIEQDILKSVSKARSYKGYFEKKVIQYNSKPGDQSMDLSYVLGEAYGERGVLLDLEVDKFRSIAYRNGQKLSFFRIDTNEVIDSAVEILTIMRPDTGEKYLSNGINARQMVNKYKRDILKSLT